MMIKLSIVVFFISFLKLYAQETIVRSKGDRKPSNAERSHFLGSKNKSKPGYQTRYFIIKSLNYDNIQLSVERGIWATQVMNEPILEGAFHNSGRVVLIFSVNMSGFFQGYAEMLSPVGWRRDHIWSQGGGKNNPWGRSFKVKWLRLSELPFQKTLHLKNPLNDYKPVKISRDCQELPGDIGEALCELLDAHSCDDGLLNSSSRDGYSTKRSRVEPPSSSGDEEYNNNMWGHYPPAVYSNQDDLSRFHLAQQGGYGVEQEKYLQFNSWGLPLESPLASTLTDDDFLNMSYEEYVEIHSRCMRQLGLPVIPQSHATQEPSSKTDDGSNGSSKDRSLSRKRGRDSS